LLRAILTLDREIQGHGAHVYVAQIRNPQPPRLRGRDLNVFADRPATFEKFISSVIAHA
jgi:hypothetical protein